MNETMKPLKLMNEARLLKSKRRANPFFDKFPERGVALAHLPDRRLERRVKEPVLPVRVIAEDVEDPDIANDVGDRTDVACDAPNLGDGFIAFRAGSRVESDPARLVLLILADVGLDPAMGMLLADVHGLGELVPVAPLEAVDQARGDVDGTQQKGQPAGEVLAMAFLAVDQEVLHGVETAIDHVHLQGVGELAGIAEEALHRPGPGGDRLDSLTGQVLDHGQRDFPEPCPESPRAFPGVTGSPLPTAPSRRPGERRD